MATKDGSLYLVCTHTYDDNAVYIERFSPGTGWQDIGAADGWNGDFSINAMCIQGDYLYIAGHFRGVANGPGNTSTNADIAKYHIPSGSWSDVGSQDPFLAQPMPGLIQAMTVDAAGRVYVAQFSGGTTFPALPVEVFDPGASPQWSQITNSQGGWFYALTNSNLESTRASAGAQVTALATDGTNIIIGGYFDGVGQWTGDAQPCTPSVPSANLIRWDGTNWHQLVTNYVTVFGPPMLVDESWAATFLDSVVVHTTNVFAASKMWNPQYVGPLAFSHVSIDGVSYRDSFNKMPNFYDWWNSACGQGYAVAWQDSGVFILGGQFDTSGNDAPPTDRIGYDGIAVWDPAPGGGLTNVTANPQPTRYDSSTQTHYPMIVSGIAAGSNEVYVVGSFDRIGQIDLPPNMYGTHVARLVLGPITNAPPTGTNCTPPAPGLVGWWKAEGDATDAMGVNNGSLVGDVTLGSGYVGQQAFVFDGRSGYVTIPASASLDVGAGDGFTIEGWIKPQGDLASNLSCLAEWNDGAGNLGAHFWLSQPAGWPYMGGGPGCLFINLVDTGFNFHTLSTSNHVVSSGTWQHVAVTYDRSSGIATIYCNGSVMASQYLGIFEPQTRYALNFGQRPSFGDIFGAFNGEMDEMSLYKHALSAADIQAIYNAGSAGKCGPVVCTPPSSDLVSWWKAEGNATDAMGANNGSLVGNATFGSGYVGQQAFAFDGSLGYVTIPAYSPSLNVGAGDGFTIEGWIKPQGYMTNNWACLAEWNDGAGNLGAHFWLSQPPGWPFMGSGPGCLFINLVDTDFNAALTNTGSFHTLSSPANVVTSGTWQHVAVTYDKGSGVAMIYHNGLLVAEQNLGIFQPQTGYALNFGRRTSFEDGFGPFKGQVNYAPFKGEMDEMSLYKQALSADQIRAIYIAGTAGKCGP